jgi:hypothetical protein
MSKISEIVGFTTIFFVFLVALTIIFPSLFSSIFGKFPENLVPYELGAFAVPLIISNIGLLSFGILYYKKKLPGVILDSINRVRVFEIPKKPTYAILLIIFAVYIGISTPDLFLNESENWPDYSILDSALELWPDGKSDNRYVQEQNDRYVRMFLLDSSLKIFENIKVLPFVASILVILFTYLLTVQITQKRFAGIISILILIQSHTFLKFDTIAVYENFWILFYLISIYVIRKKWIFSPIFYILAFFTKAFVAPYFVMTLFFTLRSQLSFKIKLAILLSYLVIIGIAAIVIFAGDTLYPSIIDVNSSKFFIGLATFGPLLRYDFILLLTLPSIIVGLTLLTKNKVYGVDSIIFLILGSLLSGPLLVMFTNFYEILPYRFIPLIVFFSIGISLFFSKKKIIS